MRARLLAALPFEAIPEAETTPRCLEDHLIQLQLAPALPEETQAGAAGGADALYTHSLALVHAERTRAGGRGDGGMPPPPYGAAEARTSRGRQWNRSGRHRGV